MGAAIACIGSGNMGSALMKGIARTVDGADIGFADRDMEKAAAAAAAMDFGARVYASNTEAAEKADYVFLAVKPQVLGKVLAEIAPVALSRLETGRMPALVSMAAGWGIDRIRAAIAGDANASANMPAANVPVARIMPNTPALISKGMIALAVSSEFPAEKTAALETMLGGAGTVDVVGEHGLDAITGLSGSGPAFAYLFIDALADGGVLAGLPRDKALLYAANTVFGSAAMVLETGKHPGELKDMVCSPGGTTIAGISALEAGSFRSTVIKAVEAAWRRSMALSAGESQ